MWGWSSWKTRRTAIMGTAYSDSRDCSAADRGGSCQQDNKYAKVSARGCTVHSAVQRVFQHQSLALGNTINQHAVQDKRRRCDVHPASGLHVSHVPGGTHLNGSSCASAITLTCAVACCRIKRLPRTKACNRPRPPIATVSRPCRPIASASHTRLTPSATLRWCSSCTTLSLHSHSRDSCPAHCTGLLATPRNCVVHQHHCLAKSHLP